MLPSASLANAAAGRLYPGRGYPAVSVLRPSEPPRLRLPRKLQFLFRTHAPDGRRVRYRVAWGGRGGAKSWGYAKTLLVLAASKTLRILCARELQVSITDSVHKLLADQIAAEPELAAVYDVQKTSIKCLTTGSEFLFAGIRNNVTKIKSMEGVDICWVEEAEKVSKRSWEVLIPTIRKPGSEIWVSFNPDEKTDPTSQMFLVKKPPPGSIVQFIGWQDNPWFPEELRIEKDYLYSVDPEAAEHVWGGAFRRNSAAQVLRGKYVVEAFRPEVEWAGPYFGADWGFSQDPSALVKLYIHQNVLYVYGEAYGIGVDIDKTPDLFDTVPGARKARIESDNARPETISYMQRHGYPGCVPVTKWAGSVEDGVAFLRSFEKIVIHPSCVHTAEEARLWSYKVDKLTKEPLAELDDKHNHCMDAIRYALVKLIRQSKLGMLSYMKDLAMENRNA